jgi:non-specific serine/threonine protein kinase
MLETVRLYGLRQLEHTGELAMLRDRQLRWCVTLAEQASPALMQGDPAVWLARLEREHDNLRSALQWALDSSASTLALRLAAGLWPFWRGRRRHLNEGRRWLSAILALPIEDNDRESKNLRASVLEGAAWLAEDEHDFAQASAFFEESEELRRSLGQKQGLAGSLINTAMEARARGNYARATALLEQSLTEQRALGNRDSIKRGGLGLTLSRLALVLAERGLYPRATALYEECLALHRDLNDREGAGYALLGLGDVARDLGDTTRVHTYCDETLLLFRELGHPLTGFSLNNLALAAYAEGDLPGAHQKAQEAVALFRELQAGPSLAEALVTLGRMQGAQGGVDAARASLAEALALAWARGPRIVAAAALDELGFLTVQRESGQYGVHLLAAAATLRQQMGTPLRPADRLAFQNALSQARASLGVAVFQEAWATGQSRRVAALVADIVAGPRTAGRALLQADSA